MSKLYQVTNKDTFARAIVCADSPEQARTLRPDSGIRSIVWREWRGGCWVQLGSSAFQDKPATPLTCWPTDLERVHADEIGTAGRMYSGTTQILVFDRDAQLRRPSEGPDDSWGALFTQLGGSR